MAKYTVTFSCGHTDTVELFGKGTDRERKIKYFEESGLCKECYKKKMRGKEEQEGLIFNVSVLPYINNDDGSILVSVWFSGNTMPHKDDIKALGGYHWSERDSADDFFSMKSVPKCWNKEIKLDDLSDEAKKAESIGAEKVDLDNGLFGTINYKIALDKQNKWKEKQEAINKIEKPIIPEILKGHKWNQKVYGKSGNHTVYLDGNKVDLSDDEAEEIERYIIDKENYNKMVEEIADA